LASAVRERERQGHALTVPRVLDQVFDRVTRGGRQVFEITDHVHADAVLAQIGALLLGELDEQAHERFHFVARTRPIRDAERVQREVLDTEPRGGFDRFANGPRAFSVTLRAIEAASLCPTTVAIHDDRDVARNFGVAAFAVTVVSGSQDRGLDGKDEPSRRCRAAPGPKGSMTSSHIHGVGCVEV